MIETRLTGIRLITLQVIGARIGQKDLLKKVYEQPLILTANELAQGIVSPVEDARMHRLLAKLLAGKLTCSLPLRLQEESHLTQHLTGESEQQRHHPIVMGQKWCHVVLF